MNEAFEQGDYEGRMEFSHNRFWGIVDATGILSISEVLEDLVKVLSPKIPGKKSHLLEPIPILNWAGQGEIGQDWNKKVEEDFIQSSLSITFI